MAEAKKGNILKRIGQVLRNILKRARWVLIAQRDWDDLGPLYRVERNIVFLSYKEAVLRYNALYRLRAAFRRSPEYIIESRVGAILPLLADEVWWVRSAAFLALRTIYQLRPEVMTERIVEKAIDLLDEDAVQVCLCSFLLPCLPHPGAKPVLEEYPAFKEAGMELDSIGLTNQLFSELDLADFTIGAQALVKVTIYASAKDGKKLERIREELSSSILPAIRLMEYLSRDMPTVGMEIHRAINPKDPSDQLLAYSQAILANYFGFIKTEHSLGESHIVSVGDQEQLEIRVMPDSYPVFKLIVDAFVDIGLLPDSRRHFYLSTNQGDLRGEIISLLVSTYFLDLPYELGLQVLRSYIPESHDTLGFPGCYTYIGVSLDPHTGSMLGRQTQSNIFNKMIALSVQLFEDAPIVPIYLYKTDLERKALLSTAALAYLKPGEEKSPLEEEMASVYGELREKLRDLYSHDLGLTSREAAQLLGEGYMGAYHPPDGVDTRYIYNSVELLRQRLLEQPSRLEILAQALDEAADSTRSLLHDPELARVIDLFYLGQPKEVLPALTGLLYSVQPEQRRQAARLLGIAGGPQARLLLEANINSSDKALRLDVVEALARIGDVNSIPVLKSQFQKDEEPEVKASLEALVAALTPVRSVPPQELLRDDQSQPQNT